MASVELLPFFVAEDSATRVEEIKSAKGCDDSPEGWAEEGAGYDCNWYSQHLADESWTCDSNGYVGTDGLTAEEACCACGGGSTATKLVVRPDEAKTCTKGALLDNCVAAAADSRFTYLVCPDYVEQIDKRGGSILYGTEVEVDEGGAMSFTKGDDDWCPEARSINIKFECGEKDEIKIWVTEPRTCAYEGTVKHPCACE